MDFMELMKILACPACRHSLEKVPDGLLCDHCKIVYPIVDDIPVLLIEKGVPLDKWQNKEAS